MTARVATAKGSVIWPVIVLVVLTTLAYSRAATLGFVNWDDPSYITDNPVVLHGLTWASLQWALTTTHPPYWHPLTWLSHLLDVQMFGLDVGLHHVTSVALHLINSILLFLALRRMTGAAGRSLVVAALFAVHPLHVESVAWLSERKDVLSTFFVFISLNAYAWYASDTTFRRGRYLLVLAAFACALMAKPMVVTFPFLLLLLDYWPLQRFDYWPDRKLVVEKIPMLVMAIGTGIATFVTQVKVGAVGGLGSMSVSLRLENAAISYVMYLRKVIWPTNLAALSPYRWSVSFWSTALAVAVLAGVSVCVVAVRKSRPYLFVGWVWYLVALLPVIGLLQAGDQAMADRFMYVPIVGLLIGTVWSAVDLARSVRSRVVLRITATAIIVILAWISRGQLDYWTDSISLWNHTIEVTSGNYHAYENLGTALRDAGSLDQALQAYREAARYAPSYAVLNNSMGLVLTAQGKTSDAVAQFATAVRLQPDFAEARVNLANALATEGQLADAAREFSAAIQLQPDSFEAHLGLGGVLLRNGNAGGAAAEYQHAVRLNPDSAQAHNGLGTAMAQDGEALLAKAEFAAAIRLKPDLATAHANLAFLSAAEGANAEAIAEFSAALALDPQQPAWHYNLAVVFVRQGVLADARHHLEMALAIDPTFRPAADFLKTLVR